MSFKPQLRLWDFVIHMELSGQEFFDASNYCSLLLVAVFLFD